MKKLLILFLLANSFFVSCKKDPFENYYFGYATATVNDKPVMFYRARGALQYGLEDTIGLAFEKWSGSIPKVIFGFAKIHKSISTQRVNKYDYTTLRIEKLCSSYTTMRSEDEGCDRYEIYEPDSLQNLISITSYDPESKQIKGTFQVTYLRDFTIVKCDPSAPDTIRIRNGIFHTKIL